MPDKDILAFLGIQLERTLAETRRALHQLAKSKGLSGSASLLVPILDNYEFEVSMLDGNSTFDLDLAAKTITFRGKAMLDVWNNLYGLAEEIKLSAKERQRLQEAGLNQLIVHELVHVTQMLWDFSAVPDVKAGLPQLGLPILDLAADVEAALISAQIECCHLAISSHDGFLDQLINALMRAYIIGAFVFDARSNPAKRQRAIGLIISLVLIKSELEGRLGAENLNPNWTPAAPVLAFDISLSHRFNGFILSEHIGLLLSHNDVPDGELLDELWDSVGQYPIERIVALVSIFLRAAKAIV